MPDWIERRHILDYDSACAIRYHGRRKSFLSSVSSKHLASIVFASVALTIEHGADVLWIVLPVFAVASLASLGLMQRAKKHGTLLSKWITLRAALSVLSDATEAQLRTLELVRSEIDAQSPPAIGRPVGDCRKRREGRP